MQCPQISPWLASTKGSASAAKESKNVHPHYYFTHEEEENDDYDYDDDDMRTCMEVSESLPKSMISDPLLPVSILMYGTPDGS